MNLLLAPAHIGHFGMIEDCIANHACDDVVFPVGWAMRNPGTIEPSCSYKERRKAKRKEKDRG